MYNKGSFRRFGPEYLHPAVGALAISSCQLCGPMSRCIEPSGFSGELITGINPLVGEIGAEISRIELYQNLLFGNAPGFIGGGTIFVIIGGLVLLVFRAVDIKTTLSYLAAVALTSLAFGADPSFNLLAGGVMLLLSICLRPCNDPLYWKGR